MDAKTRAKALLKTNKMAQGDDDHARAMRAYWRGVGAGRNVAYLLKQKGDAGKGAKHAQSLLSEADDQASGTCQVCQRKLKLTKKGEVARHGYRQASGGTGQSCPGGYEPPSESGQTGALRKEIKRIEQEIESGDLRPRAKRQAEFALKGMRRRLGESDEFRSEGTITENVGQTIWSQLKQMKLNGFPLPRYLGAKNPSASSDGLTVDLRGKWKGRVVIKLNKATDLYDLTFGRIRKYQWIEDSKVLGVEVGNLAHVLQRYVEYGEAKKKRTKKGKTISASIDEDYTATDLDAWWAESRPKLIKGGKTTRLGRMNGCIRSLRSLRDGGIEVTGQSQTDLNPVPKKERDSEDQPVDKTPGRVDEDINYFEAQENDMSLNDAIAAFRGLDEANIPAPAVKRSTNGKGQISPKSRFSPSYHKVAAPSDAEAMAAATRSTAGVKDKATYGADGRENVDVRVEDLSRDQLAQVLEDIAKVSVNPEKFLEMVNQEIGLDKLDEGLVAAVGNHVFGHGSIKVQTETRSDLHNKGMGLDDFSVGNEASDLAFADGMLNDTLDKRGAYKTEANIPAPKVGRTNAGGSQISPTSKFARDYDPVNSGTRKDYERNGVAMPADAEAMAAAERATAGVSGPGYGADGREEVDVRVESRQGRGQEVYDESFFLNQGYTPPSR